MDFRECRSHECSDAPDQENLDVHRGSGRDGAPATVFTRLIRDGDETFIQYWLYYPDSTSTWMGSAGVWNTTLGATRAGSTPAITRTIGNRSRSASTAAGNARIARSRPTGATAIGPTSRGWSRVSYGSHAGHIPQPVDPDERTTTGAGVRIVPLEGLTAEERATEFRVSPPWDKAVYRDPWSDSTG